MAAGIDTARALREDTARALREQAGTELRLLCMVSRNLLTSELRSSRPGRRSFADVHVPSNLTAFADRYRAQDVVSQCLRKLMGGRPLSGAMGKTLPGLYTGRFMLL